jgi:endoglucanase
MPCYDAGVRIELLRELVESHGVPGFESSVRAIVERELSGLGDATVDAMGSLIVRRGPKQRPRVAVVAHMDEIGFLVRFIEKEGFLRLQPLGGFDPRQLNSKRVTVNTRSGVRAGTLNAGVKPPHLLSDAERNAPQKIEDFFVDLGLSAEAVHAEVHVGDTVALHQSLEAVGDLWASKAMDDRVGVFVMIEALRAVAEPTCEIVAVASTQEEIGLRGAAAAGSSVEPDIAIALDITLANDIPGIPESEAVTRLGQGVAIKIMDSSHIGHPGLVAHLRRLAEEKGIPHQMEILPRGGTDAAAIQRLHGGIPTVTLSIPTRYVHTTNETVHPRDVQAAIDLLIAFQLQPDDFHLDR